MMKLAVVGLSHKTAPVEVRERLAFSADRVQDALTSLVSDGAAAEALILSTCNRVEVVAEGPDESVITDFIAQHHRVPAEAISHHLYAYRNAEAVRHVFRVASSLDSMVIGEPQILGQVKEAFRVARIAGTIGLNLGALMTSAFTVAKRVRSETGIAHSAVSVGYAAVELARRIFGDLNGKCVMIIGASKMGELTARHLRRNGVTSVLVTNRTFERAVEVARVFEGAAVPFEHFRDHIDRADIVISSTGAPNFIISKQDAEQIMFRRKNRPIFIIDIAVPRDVDPNVNEIDNAFLYDIDDLQGVVDANLKERLKEATRAEQIIDQEVRAFVERLQTRDIVPTIVELRESLERLRRDEIERNRRLLRDLTPEQQAAVDQITQALMNKILHSPIAHLKEASQGPAGPHSMSLIRKIFNLKRTDE